MPRRSPATGCSASASRRQARAMPAVRFPRSLSSRASTGRCRTTPSPPTTSSSARTSRPGRRSRSPTEDSRSRSRCGRQRLAAVDRPAHRDRHHTATLDRARWTRHRPDLPGADRPGQPVRRARPPAVHPALVGGGDRHRRDRRHRRHDRHPELTTQVAKGWNVAARRTGSRWRPRAQGSRRPWRASWRSAPTCSRPRRRPTRAPIRASASSSASRCPAGQTYTITKYVGVRARRTRPTPRPRPGAGRVGGRDRRLGLAAGSQRGRVGGPVARADRRARQPHARHRRQRQRVLPVVEHAGRGRLERLARRGCRPTATTVTSSGTPRPGCTRRCSRSTPTWPPA